MLATTLAALVVHLLWGWQLTVLAAIFGGLWKGRGGWWIGGAGVGLSWGILVMVSFIAAPRPTLRMIETVADILGGFPAPFTVVVTVLFGVLIGTAGGGLGTQLRLVIPHKWSG